MTLKYVTVDGVRIGYVVVDAVEGMSPLMTFMDEQPIVVLPRADGDAEEKVRVLYYKVLTLSSRAAKTG